MGNQLSCIVIKGVIHDTFQIYLLDFDSGKWFHYHDVGHLDYVAAYGHELTTFEISFDCWIHDQIIFEIFFKEKRPQAILSNMNFSYSVQTRKLTKIEGIKNEDIIFGDHVILHTNSLISLPSTPT
ncbi:unnamed protein product [Lathyrus sativus]|nr:unnamed protein product [Lathyrus sativus]